MASDLTPAIGEAKLRSKEFVIVAKNGISEVWLSMGVVTKDGEDSPYVACKTCFKAFRFLSHKTGTTHLKRHIEDCKDRSGKPGKISQSKLVEAAAQLVANDIRPFSILGGKGMRTFCQTLIDVGATYGKVDKNALLPARNTVSRQLHQIAAEERGNIVNLVEKAISNNGGVAMTVDLWTGNYKKQCFLSCKVHWIEKLSQQET